MVKFEGTDVDLVERVIGPFDHASCDVNSPLRFANHVTSHLTQIDANVHVCTDAL